VFVVKALVRLLVVKDTLTAYVSHLLSLVLLVETSRDVNTSSTTAVLEQITTALVAQHSIAPQLCIQLQQNLFEWVNAYYQVSGGGSATDAALPAKIVDMSLASWRLIALSLESPVRFVLKRHSFFLNLF
jgi:hypothetical protein